MQEFDAKEIVRQYQEDMPVFEIPAEMIDDGSSREELEQGVLKCHNIPILPPEKPCRGPSCFLFITSASFF